jgi:hypothetical protein
MRSEAKLLERTGQPAQRGRIERMGCKSVAFAPQGWRLNTTHVADFISEIA